MTPENTSNALPPGKSPIHFEALEQRILLTTIHGGDFFIYYNSQQEAVRIDFLGSTEDTAELLSTWDVDLARDDYGRRKHEIVDLVGILNGDVNNPINWPALNGFAGGEERTFDEPWDLPDPDWTGFQENEWLGVWQFHGDTDEIEQSNDIDDPTPGFIEDIDPDPEQEDTRGIVQGISGADGRVLAFPSYSNDDVTQTVTFNIDQAGMGFGLIAHGLDTNSDGELDTYYSVRATASDTLRIYKRFYSSVIQDFVETEILDTGEVVNAGTDYGVRFNCEGDDTSTTLQVSLWDDVQGDPGEDVWEYETTDAQAVLQGVFGRFGMIYELNDTARTETDDYSANYLSGSEIVEWDDEGHPQWIEFEEPSGGEPGTRGAETELFAIVITKCSENSRLIISTLEEDELWDENGDGRLFTNLNQWESESIPILGVDNSGDDVYANDGSGGVLVGARHVPKEDEVMRYIATQRKVTVETEGVLGENWGTGVLADQEIEAGITITNDDQGQPQNFDRIKIGGTVSGELTVPGTIEIVEMGFIWCNITVGHNLSEVVIHLGGGAVDIGSSLFSEFLTPDNGSHIHAEGTIDMIMADAFANTEEDNATLIYSSVEAENDPTISYPQDIVYEIEDELDDRIDVNYDLYWRAGDLLDVYNDTVQLAQFINHPTGYFTLIGQTTAEDPADWYALPLMAGQTIQISGVTGGLSARFYGPGQGREWLAGQDVDIEDPDYFPPASSERRWLDTIGVEFEEDIGFGNGGFTAEPMVFTAPEAGIYYIEMNNGTSTATTYALDFANATHASLGGVSIIGDYCGVLYTGTGSASGSNFATKNGGDLGAVLVTAKNYVGKAYAIGGGDLVCYEAGQLGALEGENTYWLFSAQSDSNIGRIASTAGDLADNTIQAGSSDYNRDADIQNIYALEDWVAGVNFDATATASGSIGTIEVGGSLADPNSMGYLTANSDGYGPVGHIDLIHVGDTWGNVSLEHGAGGDIGYVYIGGQAYTALGLWLRPINPTVVEDGSTTVINDDGGGRITIEPEEGTTYSYLVIPVEGMPNFGAGGIGGTISNLTISGPAQLTVDGLVQIGHLDLTGAGAEDEITIGDVGGKNGGRADIYYVQGSSLALFENDTYGGNPDKPKDYGCVVSAGFANIQTMRLSGDLGRMNAGHTDAWFFGHEQTPEISEDEAESTAQFGWWHGTINGMNVTGTLDHLSVGGYLGDLRVAGRMGVVEVNTDNWTDPGIWNDWDGVGGLVWSATRIDEIYVGDGLADDGNVEVAVSAIMCSGSIGLVKITGSRYWQQPQPEPKPYDRVTEENNWQDLTLIQRQKRNESLKEQIPFGEIQGSIIGNSDGTVTKRVLYREVDKYGNVVREWFGPSTTERVPAVEQVIGEDGSVLTANVAGAPLNVFMNFLKYYGNSASVGTVHFSGEGAMIFGSEIHGNTIAEIRTSADSEGIEYAFINGVGPGPDELCIELVVGGGTAGRGILSSFFVADGGDYGEITTEGPNALIQACSFDGTNGMQSISSQHVNSNRFGMPGTIHHMSAVQDMQSNSLKVGAIGEITTGRNFYGNTLEVSSYIEKIRIGGTFASSITMYGQEVSYLESLISNGNISGSIECHGHIGEIISKNGRISASITTIAEWRNDVLWTNDVDLIKAKTGFTGTLNIEGSLLQFLCDASVGSNPAVGGNTQTFDILGDIGKMNINGGASHLYADLEVGGDIGAIDIEGNFYSNLTCNGNVEKLYVDGTLGGNLGGAVGNRGSITVFGNLKRLRFNNSRDLVANITLGSSIERLSMRGADIIGNLQSLFGVIDNLRVSNGSITGNLTAVSLGRISVRDGGISGNVTAINGNVGRLDINDGNLDGNVTATNGKIESLSIRSGNVLAGNQITADAGVDRIQIRGGRLDADVISGCHIDRLDVSNRATGIISAHTYINRISIDGGLLNAVVRAGGKIDRFDAAAILSSTVSSGWDIDRFDVDGSVTNSFILAGYDVGQDGILGTADDNPANAGQVHRANIERFNIDRNFDTSVLVAGIGPGVDNDFTTLADNVEANGTSKMERMDIGGNFGANPDASAILADTYIDPEVAVPAAAAGVIIYQGVSDLKNGTGTDFGPDTAIGSSLTVGELQLNLRSGRANYNQATGELVLENTNDRSSLRITYRGAGIYGQIIQITSSDDCELRSLRVDDDVRIADLAIDGNVDRLDAERVVAGSTWNLPGNSRSIGVGNLNNVTMKLGEVNRLNVDGAYNSGTLTADALGRFSIRSGKIGADLNILLGDASRVDVRNGAFNGDMNVWGGVDSLRIDGNWTGDADILHGDLSRLDANNLTGVVNVTKGWSDRIKLGNGNLSGSLRTIGIKSLQLRSGNLTGLLSTTDNIDRLDLRSGSITGKVLAEGNIGILRIAAMNGALVAAAGNLKRIDIKGNMTQSYLFAGFNPGDSGYDPATGEAGNVALDAWDAPLNNDQQDQPFGGEIKRARIGGNMVESTISGAVAPGDDGYVGTHDDKIRGTGYVYSVDVVGYIRGTNANDESYGVYGANNLPEVRAHRQPFTQNQNAKVKNLICGAGWLTVEQINRTFNTLEVTFNHPLDFSTITEDSFRMIISEDPDFVNTPGNDTVITFEGADPAALANYDEKAYSVTLKLLNHTWDTLQRDEDPGDYYQLSIDNVITTDIRGNTLQATINYSYAILHDVPGYEWWHGCGPTAAGMLVGYYDQNTQFQNLIDGEATTQTDDVNEAIASSGNGIYTGDGGIIVAGDPGTGHIPDYALYDEIDDSDDEDPTPDMSEINQGGAHSADCLADFMRTSWSRDGLRFGETLLANIGTGLQAFFRYKSYATPTTQTIGWANYSWNQFMAEIDAGRPMILFVDAVEEEDQTAPETADHFVTAVGYNTWTQEYASYDTNGNSVSWHSWHQVTRGDLYGIDSVITVTPV